MEFLEKPTKTFIISIYADLNIEDSILINTKHELRKELHARYTTSFFGFSALNMGQDYIQQKKHGVHKIVYNFIMTLIVVKETN